MSNYAIVCWNIGESVSSISILMTLVWHISFLSAASSLRFLVRWKGLIKPVHLHLKSINIFLIPKVIRERQFMQVLSWYKPIEYRYTMHMSRKCGKRTPPSGLGVSSSSVKLHTSRLCCQPSNYSPWHAALEAQGERRGGGGARGGWD